MPRTSLAFVLLLAGCAAKYDPPLAGDHAAARYQGDLAKCQKQATTKATKTANATPQSSVRAVFASDEPMRQDVTSCMQGRGYALR